MTFFDQTAIYKQTLIPTFGAADPEGLSSILKDGRLANQLVALHIEGEFDNLRRVKIQLDGNSQLFGVEEEFSGKTYAVRTVTRACQLLPSKNLGVGREYRQEEYEHLLRNIDGFLLLVVNQAPVFRWGVIAKERLPFKAVYNASEICKLLTGQTSRIFKWDTVDQIELPSCGLTPVAA